MHGDLPEGAPHGGGGFYGRRAAKAKQHARAVCRGAGSGAHAPDPVMTYIWSGRQSAGFLRPAAPFGTLSGTPWM